MFRSLRFLLLLLAGAALLAVGLILTRAPDPGYALQEWLNRPRYWEYDELITSAGKRYNVDPMLIKAIVWRESGFSAEKIGGKGERGLMQITDAAGRDWARSEKIETFAPTDLFDPKTNLDAGAWYLSKAFERWKAKDDPIPFVLAEFNAGRRRVDRWVAAIPEGSPATAESFLHAMDFPSTRQYIADVTARYRFYQRRGRL